MDDLFSVGMIALDGVVDSFDPARGCRLLTLARPRISGAMSREIGAAPLIKVSIHARVKLDYPSSRARVSPADLRAAAIVRAMARVGGAYGEPGDLEGLAVDRGPSPELMAMIREEAAR